mmetsp:Transcript_2692/g.3100  ORF Transcript_2692/g.3100 Transcript_2692/m.3100 type:complete len:210 (-) Transcript_2692:506-1135(-)
MSQGGEREGFEDLTGNGGVLKKVTFTREDNIKPAQGDVVLMNYVGRVLGNEHEFDRNLGGYPFEFTLGEGKVISGWEIAIPTMCVGDKAKLIIAAEFAYGEEGSEDDIAPGATLEFDIEFVAIKEGANATLLTRGAEDLERLAVLRQQRAEETAKKKLDKEAKEKSKADAQAKLQAKLANKGKKGKGGKNKDKDSKTKGKKEKPPKSKK